MTKINLREKILLAGTMFRFEQIDMDDSQIAGLFCGESAVSAIHDELESVVIENVIRTMDYLEEQMSTAELIPDLDLFISLNSMLAQEQSLEVGTLRSGYSSIPCIGQLPVPDRNDVEQWIRRLNSTQTGKFNMMVAECFCSLAKIQPFWDGNKRTSLLLCNIVLMQKESVLMHISRENYSEFDRKLTLFYRGESREIIRFLTDRCMSVV